MQKVCIQPIIDPVEDMESKTIILFLISVKQGPPNEGPQAKFSPWSISL